MDMLAGYGSEGSDEEEQVQKEVQPQVKKLVPLTAAPTTTAAQEVPQEPAAGAPAAVRHKLVAPDTLQTGEADEPSIGPARPSVARVTDEKEIPGISNPEVWSKLPAPKAPARRVVQLLLPLNKALLAAAEAADDDDDKPAKKRAKHSGGSAKLLEFLPAPKNDLPIPGRGRGGGGGGTLLDLGDSGPPAQAAGKQAGSATAKAQQQQPQVVVSNEMYRVQPAAGNKGRRKADDDSDDEDPMMREGPMPEAGAYASGPVEDEGEEVGPGAAGPSGGALGEEACGTYGPQAAAMQQGVYGGYAHEPLQGPAAPAAAAYYVAGDPQPAYAEQGYYQGEGAAGAAAGEQDPGAALFAQALAAEQERAAKRGQAVDMSGIQFKEVNAKDLTYMDPGKKAALNSVRAALGAEYAAALRAEAKPFEGDKMAKRKHQIGTLFYNARMRELEILEGQATSGKHKSETQGKYGW